MTFRSALEQKLDDWTKFTVWPMFVLSVCFVAVTALVISPPRRPGRTPARSTSHG